MYSYWKRFNLHFNFATYELIWFNLEIFFLLVLVLLCFYLLASCCVCVCDVRLMQKSTKYNYQIVASFFWCRFSGAGITIIICHHRFSYQTSILDRTIVWSESTAIVNTAIEFMIQLPVESIKFLLLLFLFRSFWSKEIIHLMQTLRNGKLSSHDVAIARKVNMIDFW